MILFQLKFSGDVFVFLFSYIEKISEKTCPVEVQIYNFIELFSFIEKK